MGVKSSCLTEKDRIQRGVTKNRAHPVNGIVEAHTFFEWLKYACYGLGHAMVLACSVERVSKATRFLQSTNKLYTYISYI